MERDSVCAGDDIDAPHTRRFAVKPNATLAEAIAAVVGGRYLAPIIGGRATWIVESDRPLAVVAQQWESPAFLIDTATRAAACTAAGWSGALFFRYWRQVDPSLVFDCLREGRPLPDIYRRSK